MSDSGREWPSEKKDNDLVHLRQRIAYLETQLSMRDGTLNMAVDRLGGIVEGNPTARHNFLQRVDELVEKETKLKQTEAELNKMNRLQSMHLDALRRVSASLGNPFAGDMTKTCLDLGLEVARQLKDARRSIYQSGPDGPREGM